MAVKLSPVFNDQTLDSNNALAAGYKLFTYVSGSTTKLTTYTDAAGLVPQTNPIIINALGYPTNGPIWLTVGQSYKFVFASPTDTDPPSSPIKTIDGVTGINDASIAISQWVGSGLAPTYLSPTSFSLAGDQTSEFHVGRRVQATTSGGTVYGTILTSAYAALTTITLTMDSPGVLDAGLSVVNLSVLRSDYPAIPAIVSTAVQSQTATAFTTGGSLTAYTLTPLPPITGNANGMRFRVKFHVASGAAATLSVSGQAALPLKFYDANGSKSSIDSVRVPINWVSDVESDGTDWVVLDTSANVQRSFLSGLTLSTAGSSATMSIAAGQAADSTNAVIMNVTPISKTTAAWAVGTAAGGLDTGAVANSTWYHFFVIRRPDTGAIDVTFSLSAAAPTLPASYTQYRRIGSGKTDSSAQWIRFIQDGDYFEWITPPSLDVNATSPGSSAVTRTITVPTGVSVRAVMNVGLEVGTADCVYLSDLATTDVSPSSSSSPLGQIFTSASSGRNYGQVVVRTNTSAQIRSRNITGGASEILKISTVAWYDRRGQDS